MFVFHCFLLLINYDFLRTGSNSELFCSDFALSIEIMIKLFLSMYHYAMEGDTAYFRYEGTSEAIYATCTVEISPFQSTSELFLQQ